MKTESISCINIKSLHLKWALTVAARFSLTPASPCILDIRLPLLFPGCKRSVVRRFGIDVGAFELSLPDSLPVVVGLLTLPVDLRFRLPS